MLLCTGTDGPRLSTFGTIDFRMQRTISTWNKIDPPPHRFKYIPVQVLWQVCFIDKHLLLDSAFPHAVTDMISIVFFFLLWPGEYTNTPSNTPPFRSMDIQLSNGDCHIDIAMYSLAELSQARFIQGTSNRDWRGTRQLIYVGIINTKEIFLQVPCRSKKSI